MIRKFPDVWLIFFVASLLSVGILTHYSISLSPVSRSSHALWKQMVWIAAGILVMTWACRTDYRKYLKWNRFLLPASMVFLASVFIPGMAARLGGATSWHKLGWIYLQPAEVVKVTLALYLAGSLSLRGSRIQSYLDGVLPHILVIMTIFILMAMQPDYGTALIMILVTFTVLFFARAKWSHLVGTAASLSPFAWMLARTWPHISDRIDSWVDGWYGLEGVGYQIDQSFIALGSGGVFGMGLGQGGQKLIFLPASGTDFIYSVIGEESGLAGTVTVLLFFAGIFWRGLKIAFTAADSFGMFAAFGITICLVFQALVNMGVAIGVMPNTGITLPLVSYGGSSMVTSLWMVGILLNISSYGEREDEDSE